jgi:hypothetical protein
MMTPTHPHDSIEDRATVRRAEVLRMLDDLLRSVHAAALTGLAFEEATTPRSDGLLDAVTTDAQREAIRDVVAFGRLLDQVLVQLVDDAVRCEAALVNVPQSIEDAMLTVADARRAYRDASKRYLEKLDEWRREDVRSARVRAEAAADIQAQNVGMSPSAVDKAASNHPLYTAYKDKCAVLSQEKDALFAEVTVAGESAKAARMMLAAVLQLSEATAQLAMQQLEDFGHAIASGAVLDRALVERAVREITKPPRDHEAIYNLIMAALPECTPRRRQEAPDDADAESLLVR